MLCSRISFAPYPARRSPGNPPRSARRQQAGSWICASRNQSDLSRSRETWVKMSGRIRIARLVNRFANRVRHHPVMLNQSPKVVLDRVDSRRIGGSVVDRATSCVVPSAVPPSCATRSNRVHLRVNLLSELVE
jgi:hypothetical protein